MNTLQKNSRSPQMRIARGSPSSTVSAKSPSQLSTVPLVRDSSSPSPGRKRVHPNYLKIDDEVPPNKKLHTPTESIMKEKELLYKKLAEEKRAPFYLSQPIFSMLPLNGKFTSITPNIYSLLQHQHTASPPQALPANLTLSPSASMDLSHIRLGPNLATSSSNLISNSPGSSSSLIGNTAGISGLPTPGGSSVGTPPRPPYASQMYPTSLLKFPFSPPTPSSLGLLSPWNLSNRSLSITPQPPNNDESNPSDGTGVLQCLAGSSSGERKVLATLTPIGDSENGADSSSNIKEQNGSVKPPQTSSPNKPPDSVLMTGVPPGSWPVGSLMSAGPVFQNSPSLKSSHHHSALTSVPSPLGLCQTPFSPAMHVCSPYPGSVSSCPSVSSSSGCSSASENQDLQLGGPSSTGSKHYVLSEYHVGPHRLINEKDMDNQSEEATNSGRNTPIDVSGEDGESTESTCVSLPSQVAGKLLPSASGDVNSGHNSIPAHLLPAHPRKGRPHHKNSGSGRKPNSPCPFSVESMSSGCQPSPVNSHGYITGCHIADRPSSGVSSMSSSLSSRDSTPEPDEVKHDPHQPPQGSDVFCLVPGRLSLLSSTQKYRVTVDEVRRRLSYPECLNASVLGGILRRAKSKNGGTVLRQRLQEIGVSLPPGRRKQTELSLLTSLVESESLHLASDFNRVCKNFFPHAELAQIIARQHTGTPEAQHRISMVKATLLIVSELQAMLDAVGGPSNIQPNDPNNPYPGLTNFSLLTHGFGNPTLNTSLGVLQTYLHELLAYYECRKSIQTPDNRYNIFGDGLPQTATSASSSSQSIGMGSGLGPESIAMHGNLPPHHHPLQNPLMYVTRHCPGVHQESVSSSNSEGVAVEVALKEEPVDSPQGYNT